MSQPQRVKDCPLESISRSPLSAKFEERVFFLKFQLNIYLPEFTEHLILFFEEEKKAALSDVDKVLREVKKKILFHFEENPGTALPDESTVDHKPRIILSSSCFICYPTQQFKNTNYIQQNQENIEIVENNISFLLETEILGANF